jgi:hypothetical protein
MEFEEFKTAMQNHVGLMLTEVTALFVAEVDKDMLWRKYLDSFPTGSNELYRERREHDCSCCRHFIKQFGNVVSIKNNKVTTIWDFETNDPNYQAVAKAMSKFVKTLTVTDIFATKFSSIGVDKNIEQAEDKSIKTWEHFHIDLPKSFVNIDSSDSEGSVMGKYRDIRNVFKRSLDELTEDSVLTLLDLIAQNSLYKGEEWEGVLKSFLKYKKDYSKLNDKDKENFAWEKSLAAGPVVGKIRGHSIGTLLVDISEGTELNEAVRKYEAIVAPCNYKRPKAIFTKKMLEDAQKKIEDLGYMDSLGRRHACIEDITVNNILYASKDSRQKMSGNVFDELQKEIAVNPKSFDKVEEVSAAIFIKDILPTAKKVEVLLENKHISNMVSLIAPKVKDSKTMFKWGNNFSWAYSGNITDSMKERVKSAGGKVDGVLRFSIEWNSNHDNNSDLDAHCVEPGGYEIYFGRKENLNTTGNLDVDIIDPERQAAGKSAVENITWSNISKMKKGTYVFFVHNFNNRGGKSGFSAEIEFDGQIFAFEYNKPLRQGEKIEVGKVVYSENGFKMLTSLPSSTSSRKVWSLDTNQFQPVSVLMYSPNYWDEQDGIGHRHYFFMLKGCKNEEQPNGFFNEYLREDLLEQKRVFEALGSKMRVEDNDNQLSGIGFSSTKRNELICKVEGNVSRMLKVKF